MLKSFTTSLDIHSNESPEIIDPFYIKMLHFRFRQRKCVWHLPRWWSIFERM